MSINGINLVPTARIEARQRRVRIRFWLTVAIAYCGVVASVSGAGYSYRKDDQARVLQAINETKAGAQRESARLETTISQLKQAEAKLNLLREIGDQPNWSLLLEYLSQAKGERIVLLGVRIDPGKAGDTAQEKKGQSAKPKLIYTLEVEGAGLAPTDVTGFVLTLERSGIFQRVSLMQTSRSIVQSTSASTFTIICELRG